MNSLAYLETQGKKEKAVNQAVYLWKEIQATKSRDDLGVFEPLEKYCRGNAAFLLPEKSH